MKELDIYRIFNTKTKEFVYSYTNYDLNIEDEPAIFKTRYEAQKVCDDFNKIENIYRVY
jgi:hypothetical protein